MEVTGYITPDQTGFHNFELDNIGSTVLFIGSGLAFDCCSQLSDFTSTEPVVANGLNEKITPQDVYMEVGVNYPFRLVYVIHGLLGRINIKMNLPDGGVDSRLGSKIHAFVDYDAPQCIDNTPTAPPMTSA